MKKIVLMTTAILLIIILTCTAINAQESDYIYTTNGDTATVIGYTGVQGVAISVPDSIDGYRVTAIADNAFDSLIASAITIPEGVVKVGKGAFAHSAVSVIQLPSTVECIGADAFKNCWQLESINVNEGGSYYSLDGVLYRGGAESSSLICYPTAKEGKSFIIPASVTSVRAGAIVTPTHLRFVIENPARTAITLDVDAISASNVLLLGYSDGVLMDAAAELGIECADVVYMDSYSDVSLEHWYTADILKASSRGFMSGKGNGRFSPNTALTREQFIQILFNMNSLDKAHFTGATGFTDVSQGAWYSAAIKWAADAGITSGVSEGRFGLSQPVTREQLALFLMNYVKALGIPCEGRADLSGYKDAGSISPWAKDAVAWAVSQGLFYSTGDGMTVSPKSVVTRAVTARVMVRFSDNMMSTLTMAEGDAVGILPDPFRGTDVDDGLIISDEAFVCIH